MFDWFAMGYWLALTIIDVRDERSFRNVVIFGVHGKRNPMRWEWRLTLIKDTLIKNVFNMYLIYFFV